MPNIQNSIKSNQSIKSSLSSQKTQNQDLRDRGAGQVSAVPEVEFTLEIKDDALNGAESPLSLEVSLYLERGLNGKWEIKCSNTKEVGCSGVGPRKLSLGPMHLLKLPYLTHLMSTNLSPSPLWSGNPKEKN